MKVAGVITEYNPFHNGHKYQLEQIKRQTSADYIVVVMSGDFVQRGEPAIIDKYERTRMALLSGADLVLELPAVFATASAEFFCRWRSQCTQKHRCGGHAVLWCGVCGP